MCAPCRAIEPVVERLAHEKGDGEDVDGSSVAFAKVEVDNAIAVQHEITATPAFLFFWKGEVVSEVKGANVPELRWQVDLLQSRARPPHPHASLSLPAVEAVPRDPILFSQVPALDTVLTKLSSFIDTASSWPSSDSNSRDQVNKVLSSTVIPYLKSRFAPATQQQPLPSATPEILVPWAQATSVLADALPAASLFPVVDLWRLALVDPAVGTWVSSSPSLQDPIKTFFDKCINDPAALQQRSYILTLLRLLSNAFSTPVLSRRLLTVYKGIMTTDIILPNLTNADPLVRTAAVSLAFNIAAWVQRGRVGRIPGTEMGYDNEGKDGILEAEEDGEWEVEMVLAVVNGIGQEDTSEDVVRRLTSTLAFLLHLSPIYDAELAPLLEALNSQDVLMQKIVNGVGGVVWEKDNEVRLLVEEVAKKLCSPVDEHDTEDS